LKVRCCFCESDERFNSLRVRVRLRLRLRLRLRRGLRLRERAIPLHSRL